MSPEYYYSSFFDSHEKKARLKVPYRKYSVSHLPSFSRADGQSHVTAVVVLGIPPSTISANQLYGALARRDVQRRLAHRDTTGLQNDQVAPPGSSLKRKTKKKKFENERRFKLET